MMKILGRMKNAARSHRYFLAAGAAALVVTAAGFPADALAATQGAEFNGVYDLVKAWSTGGLGKVISLAFLLVGLAIGVLRGSILAAVSTLSAAVALLLGPSSIDALFTTAGG